MLRSTIAVLSLLIACQVASAQQNVPHADSGAIPVRPDNTNTTTPQSGPAYATPAGYQPTPVIATNGATADPAKKQSLQQKLRDLDQLQEEICRLRMQTGTPQQIVVRTQILEVSLTKMEKLGIAAPFVTSGYATMSSEVAAQLLGVLRKQHVAKVLAEPTVVALDGQPVSFHVGGEIPVPNAAGSNQAPEFRPVGTELDLVPQSRGDNRVRIAIKARLSEADQANTIEVGGVRIPAFHVQQIATGIELAFGETTVLSGLVDTRTERVKVGDKVTDVENRIGTILVVTPESVEPLPTTQKPAGQVTRR